MLLVVLSLLGITLAQEFNSCCQLTNKSQAFLDGPNNENWAKCKACAKGRENVVKQGDYNGPRFMCRLVNKNVNPGCVSPTPSPSASPTPSPSASPTPIPTEDAEHDSSKCIKHADKKNNDVSWDDDWVEKGVCCGLPDEITCEEGYRREYPSPDVCGGECDREWCKIEGLKDVRSFKCIKEEEESKVCPEASFDTERTCEDYDAWCDHPDADDDGCLDCSHCKAEDRYGGRCPECPDEVSLCDKIKAEGAERSWSGVDIRIKRGKKQQMWPGRKHRDFSNRGDDFDPLCECVNHCRHNDIFVMSTQKGRNGKTFGRCKCWDLPEKVRKGTLRTKSKNMKFDTYQMGVITTHAKSAVTKAIASGRFKTG